MYYLKFNVQCSIESSMFNYISSIERLGFDRILVERRPGSSGTVGTGVSVTFSSCGTICPDGGTSTKGVVDFSFGTDCC